jgi:hypothetical protein
MILRHARWPNVHTVYITPDKEELSYTGDAVILLQPAQEHATIAPGGNKRIVQVHVTVGVTDWPTVQVFDTLSLILCRS